LQQTAQSEPRNSPSEPGSSDWGTASGAPQLTEAAGHRWTCSSSQGTAKPEGSPSS